MNTALVALLIELGSTQIPPGWTALCHREPSFCERHSQQTVTVTRDLLTSVNTRVNHWIKPESDQDQYGVPEYWTIPTTSGDCEDYTLLKRQILLQKGVPDYLLLITLVHDEAGNTHAVLTVPMPDGDLILDNRRDDILPWWKTGYKFIKRQSHGNPLDWVSVGPKEPKLS